MSGEPDHSDKDGKAGGDAGERRRRRRRRGGGGERAAEARPEQAAREPQREARRDQRPEPRPVPRPEPRPGQKQGQRAEPRPDRRPEPRPDRRPEPRPDRRSSRPQEPRPDRRTDAPRVIDAPPRASSEADHDDDLEAAEPRFVPEPDDGAPAPAIELRPDLPPEPPPGELDPVSYGFADADGDNAARLAEPIACVVGVTFATAGKISFYDARDARYRRGDRVVVETERGTRVGTVAVDAVRRPAPDRQLRRVLRRASDHDLRAEAAAAAQGEAALRAAKDAVRRLGLPVKVFRVEAHGGRRLVVYYASEDRVDLRDLLRELGGGGTRVELRQLGARDEAKAVGGIGSCGLELCCSTWLPEMVPVSIKMAKDQGLVLNPTKVSGQCGRLKCCLVYEQATYAELRKGLPKLGKRVITPTGEGRVVEVDVLRQRVRVATGPGEFQVLPATEVRPMFPSASPSGHPSRAPSEPDPSADDPSMDPDDDADPSADPAS